MFIVTSKNNFVFFQIAPVVVYRLMTSVFSTSQHRCYLLSRCLCKHFNKNDSKYRQKHHSQVSYRFLTAENLRLVLSRGSFL